MKKIASVGLVMMMFVPLFANAAWWNPISWFTVFFHPQPQVIEKIVYLPATTSPIVTPATPTTTPAISQPITSNNNQTQSAVSLQEQAYQAQVKLDTNNAASIAAQQATTQAAQQAAQKKADTVVQQPIQQQNGYRVCAGLYANATWDGTSYTSSGGFSCSCAAGFTSSSDSKSCIAINSNNAAISAEQAKQNSPECAAATSAYNQINQQYLSAQSAYNQQYSNILNRVGGTADEKAQEIDSLQQQNGYSLTNVALSEQSALNAKNSACEIWQPTSAPIINTNCTVTGSVANCYSQ